MKRIALTILVSLTCLLATASIPQTQLRPPADEPDALLIPEGASFTCTHPSGCVVTTPEALQAALQAVHQSGAQSCRRAL